MIVNRPLPWWLATTGGALILLFIPNGVMHIYLGSLVYARDFAVAMHLGVTLFCLYKTGHLHSLRGKLLPLALFTAFFAPLLGNSATLRDGLVVVKWVFLWADVFLTGYLIYLNERWIKTVNVIAIVALGLMALDGMIGFYELRTNSFVFKVDKTEETDAGVRVARSKQLSDTVRVQGLQRDVFSFANFMGVGLITCLAVIGGVRIWWLRASAFIGVLGFLYVGFYSGGRSALFGIALALGCFTLAMVAPRLFQLHGRKILTAAVFTGCVICYIGLAPILTSAVALVNHDSRVFNLASTWERDAVWWERFQAMGSNPVSYLFGIPVATYLDGAPWSVVFCDNQVLWLFYHTGVGGMILMLGYIYNAARPRSRYEYPALYLALVMYLGLLFGEGIARDTFVMFSVVPVFLLMGYFTGADAYRISDHRRRGAGAVADLIEREEALALP